MNPKYRILLAVLLTVLAFCGQTVFGQTQNDQQIVHVNHKSVQVSSNFNVPNGCKDDTGPVYSFNP